MTIRRFSLGVALALAVVAIMVGVSNHARAAAVCTPTSTVSGAYARNGAGDVCFQTATLCSYINSWNMNALEINGTDYTNRWVDSRTIAPLNGMYIIHYVGAYAWSHFEIGGTCSTTPPPTTPAVTTPPPTTPAVTTPPPTTPAVTTPPPTTPAVTTPPPTTQAGQGPYGGALRAIPGTIQAEDYDTGGEGVAYHDTTASNSGNAYRTNELVDVESTTDSGGGYNVGWTAAGEWLEYTVNVTAGGTYTLSARVASQSSGGTMHVEVDGVNVTGAISIPSTGGWQTWTTVTRTGTSLSAGQHVLRIAMDSAGFNINWVSLTTGVPPTTPPPTTPPPTTPPPTTPPPTTPPATTPPPTIPPGGFLDNLDNYNTSLFQKADGWTNGDPFNVGWRADHVNFSGGIMTITLDNQTCPSGCSNRPYASGEYRRSALTDYGRYEARFKAAKGSGIVGGTLFTYTGPSDNQPWDEIDIEILGKDTTRMQTNYYTNGTGGHESMINLGFDASAGFHTYAFEWTASSIRWYVDGALVHTENGSRGALPTHPSKLMMNMWPGIGVDGWLGSFNYTGPLQFQVDWIRYTPMQ